MCALVFFGAIYYTTANVLYLSVWVALREATARDCARPLWGSAGHKHCPVLVRASICMQAEVHAHLHALSRRSRSNKSEGFLRMLRKIPPGEALAHARPPGAEKSGDTAICLVAPLFVSSLGLS